MRFEAFQASTIARGDLLFVDHVLQRTWRSSDCLFRDKWRLLGCLHEQPHGDSDPRSVCGQVLYPLGTKGVPTESEAIPKTETTKDIERKKSEQNKHIQQLDLMYKKTNLVRYL